MVPLLGTPRWGGPRAWLPVIGRLVVGLVLVAWSASAPARAVSTDTARAVAGLEKTVRASVQAAPSFQPPGVVQVEPVTLEPSLHPLDSLDAVTLRELLAKDPKRLGPAAIGRANRGRLINPAELLPSPHLHVVNADRSFGTRVTVESLYAAAADVEQRYPGSPPLKVGDLSAERGGYIRPHRSHQTGLDADVGFYYRDNARWYTKANAENLDRERTWALVKALIVQGTVEYIFVDRSVQALLREHALAAGEPEAVLGELFESPGRKDTVIRHTWGHLTHLHVRFIDPAAEETGRRLSPLLDRFGRPKAVPRAPAKPAARRKR